MSGCLMEQVDHCLSHSVWTLPATFWEDLRLTCGGGGQKRGKKAKDEEEGQKGT